MTEKPPDSTTVTPNHRFRWFRHDGIDLGDVVVQFLAVLLGVLFALLINQWNDHRQQEAQAQAQMRQQQATVKEALRAIDVELAGNRAARRCTGAWPSFTQTPATSTTRRPEAARGHRWLAKLTAPCQERRAFS